VPIVQVSKSPIDCILYLYTFQ